MEQETEVLQKRIRELEIELRHLRNDCELIREENETTTVKYLEMLRTLEQNNQELAEMNERIESQKAEIDNQFRLFRTLLDEIPTPVFYKDAHGAYLGCNKAFCQAKGLVPGQVEGKSVYDLYPRHEAELYDRMDDQLIRSGGIQRYETRVLYADGREHDVAINKAAYSNVDGEFVGIVAVCDDVTQRKEIELELRQSNRAKDKFFSIISHDMKNPLNALMLTIEFLQGNFNMLDRDKVLELLGNVHNSAKRLNALLSNLLQWARSQSGRIPYEPADLVLSSIVTQTFNLLTSSAKEKQIALEMNMDPELQVFADYNMLLAVIRNLVSNAVKFTCDGGRVMVEATQSEKWVEIAVVDTGIGIAQEDIDKIFRIDIHYSTKGTRRETGTGLGLILCHEFVERHGGDIVVSSELGKGSTFRVRLPRTSAPAEA